MRTYKLQTSSGEEILVECDELHRDRSTGRILVVKGNEMKAYLDATILSSHELTTPPRGEATRELHHDPAPPPPTRWRSDSNVSSATPGSVPPLA